ncbi:Metal-dependent hydrolase, beta-lactamase superfamily II [Flavobacteriaceae bacterium MAR_2010_188]|nr:Metal-dependent hydrolase, beta-lactamase superfamily II [Flavobacteriaceae bacterium MAR_2010_188]
MVELLFFDVGQGDSIIIRWIDDLKVKYGIIDCKLHQGRNPVLEYCRANQIEEIEFAVLSHPHFDHFSGFGEILDSVRLGDFTLKRFVHTSKVKSDYLATANKSKEATNELQKIFVTARYLRKNKGLKILVAEDDSDRIIKLGSEFKMQFLGPSSEEEDKFINKESYSTINDEIPSANPLANWLSTIIKISNQEIAILLTSDAVKQALSRIGKSKSGNFATQKLLFAQIPHHGAKTNHNQIFWNKLKKSTTTPVIISVGNKYNHPSQEVITYFDKHQNYELYRTDKLISFPSTPKSVSTSKTLDLFTRSATSRSITKDNYYQFSFTGVNFEVIKKS